MGLFAISNDLTVFDQHVHMQHAVTSKSMILQIEEGKGRKGGREGAREAGKGVGKVLQLLFNMYTCGSMQSLSLTHFFSPGPSVSPSLSASSLFGFGSSQLSATQEVTSFKCTDNKYKGNQFNIGGEKHTSNLH